MNKTRVAKNASWIIGSQIAKSLFGVVISVLTARYLGPSNYGLINYAASVVAFVAPIMYLGFNNTIVHELVTDSEKEGEILGTAMCMSFISSLICIGGVTAFVSIANHGEKETLIVCVLYSILLVFQSIDLIQYWFQARLMSKYSSIVSFCAYAIVSAYKIFLLASDKNIYWFAVSNALDYIIISFSLLVIYRRLGEKKLSVNLSTGKRMLAKSKYYIISNLMIVIFAQTDRIMLKLMVDDAATGYYSAAVYCAQMASFVFAAIIDSVRPAVFAEREISTEAFEKSIISLYSIIMYCALFFSLFVTVFAPFVIGILYGGVYDPSIHMLQIIVWYCSASYLGGARDIWILAENKQEHLLMINALGALIYIVLNYMLIPRLGGLGAAIASVITQFAINIVFVSIYKPTRRTGYLMLQAIRPKTIYHVVKGLLTNRN